MLKLIDESLNDEKLFGVMSKDCSVYMISKNKRDIDFVRGVGEIVLLDRFSFSLWNDIKLEAKYQGTMEGIYVVESDSENSKNFIVKKSLSMNPDLERLDSELVSERVKVLEKWRQEKMGTIYNPKLGVRILNNHCVMVEPFNMILKVLEVLPMPKEITPSQTSKKLK